MTSYRYPTFALGAIALALAGLGHLEFVRGQFNPAPVPVEVAESRELRLPLLPTDRTLSRGIRRAQERIAVGEFTQAIRFLDEVLQPQQEDYFVDLGNSGEHVGLKETARRMIKALPSEGRKLYQATYGPVARRELDRANATSDSDAIRTVAFRYFHTDAGYEAAMILAQNQSDVGKHLSAALVYQELLADSPGSDYLEPQLSLLAASAWRSAGDNERAAEILRGLTARGYRSVRIGGRELSVEQLAESPLWWLERHLGEPSDRILRPGSEWLTSRGNTMRNAHVEGGLPHMRERWAVRLLDHPKLEEHHDTIESDKLRENSPLSVAGAPLAVGDYVITRSAHNLLAVDYRTGKRVWRAQPQRVAAFEDLLAERSVVTHSARDSPLRKLDERVWGDHLYNSISSDGERVFVIRDLSSQRNFDVAPFGGVMANRGGAGSNRSSTNRLCAYELASEGKLVWEIDGAKNRSQLAGAFFLGAPLWVGQSLYGLVEINGAVYLTAIDHRSGELQWKQQLVGLESNVLTDGNRRMHAAVPSYDSGMLVCSTGAGVVVGVDLAKRSLAWAYRYENHLSGAIKRRGRRRVPTVTRKQWTDPATIIADGKALIAPPDSGELHCLELLSGKLLWKQERGEFLWVAGVEGDRVLLVGNSRLKAVSLFDGSPAWSHDGLRLESGSVPSGRGFFSEGKYYLPLSTAEVLAIDVQAGTVVARTHSRDGRALGNMICYRGAVLSQTGLNLGCFDQVELLRTNSENTLLVNENDADSLRVLGEIAYNEGQMDRAIDLLQRSLVNQEDNLRTKEVLIECLEVALEDDFVAHQDQLELLRELHGSTGADQSNLLRLEAKGLFNTGDRLGAAEACLQLYATMSPNSELLEVRRDYHTDMSCWLRSQIDLIWDECTRAERETIRESLTALLEEAQSNPNGRELKRFAECFASLEISQSAQLQIAEQQLAAGDVLAAQQTYLSLCDSDDLLIQARATARCSQMLHERDLGRLALSFDKRLSGPLADVSCLEDLTGLECLSTWANVAESQTERWPYGKVNVSSIATKPVRRARGSQTPETRIRFERADDVLGRASVLVAGRNRGQIEVVDSVGKQIFQVKGSGQQGLRVYNDRNSYSVSRGNLLLVSHGTEIVAYNTLAGSDDDQQWKQRTVNVAQGLNYDSRMMYRGSVRDRRQFAPSKPVRAQRDHRWLGVIGPVTRDGFVCQDQRRLLFIDPFTGETKWWRSDVPLGCELYGDEHYLFVVPPQAKEALVFSTVDGRSMGTVSIPAWGEQLATVGRNFIRWEKLTGANQQAGKGEQRLSAIDSLNGDLLWEFSFQRGAKVDIAQGRFIVVVEPDGDSKIIDSQDGAVLAEGSFPRSTVLKDVHILAGADSFIVVREQPYTPSNERRITALNSLDYRVIDGSLMAFSRATGAPQWSNPVEVNQESFVLSQPVDLPLLAFAGTMNDRTKSGGRPTTSMAVIEKATGRLLFQNDKLPHASGNYCRVKAVDVDRPVVEIEMMNRTIRVEFTSQPRPPEPAASIGARSQRKKRSSGLLGIGLKLMGQGEK